MQRKTWDVIVAGAGPAGSVCARDLAAAGHEVLLLERDAVPGASANCTGIVGEEAFEVFDLPRQLTVNSISRIRFIGPYRQQVDYRADRPLARIVRRHRLDETLAQRAVGAGVCLRTGMAVRDATCDRHGVSILCDPKDADGTARAVRVQYRARSLVLAVGYNLKLLERIGLTGPRQFVQGVQLLCPHDEEHEQFEEADGRRVQVFVGRCHVPGSFGWAVPLDRGWIKVGLTAKHAASRLLRRLLRSPALKHRVDPERGRFRTSPIPVQPAPQTVGDRVLVVGEAAGQVKTTSHGGIYYGMLGARLAADVLSDALEFDDLSIGRLRDYERRWRSLLASELSEGRRLREAFERMSDAKLAAMMSLSTVPSIMGLIRAYADFDWHRDLIDRISSHRMLGALLGNGYRRVERAPLALAPRLRTLRPLRVVAEIERDGC